MVRISYCQTALNLMQATDLLLDYFGDIDSKQTMVTTMDVWTFFILYITEVSRSGRYSCLILVPIQPHGFVPW